MDEVILIDQRESPSSGGLGKILPACPEERKSTREWRAQLRLHPVTNLGHASIDVIRNTIQGERQIHIADPGDEATMREATDCEG